MIEPTPLTRPRWCPRCGARMRVRRNPYYGVGLAVHQYLSWCLRCDFVEFLPGTARGRDGAPAPVATRETTIGRALRSLIWWFVPRGRRP